MKPRYNTIKVISLLILGFLISNSAMASVPDPNGARQQAEFFLSEKAPSFSKVKSSHQQVLTQRYQSSSIRNTPLFVFVISNFVSSYFRN